MIHKLIQKALKGDEFKPLLEFMLASGINYQAANLKYGAVGFASLDGVYIDINRLKYDEPMAIYFTILHETGHIKRMKKIGKDKFLSDMSLENFDAFFNMVILEEKMADRYAAYTYHALTKKTIPTHLSKRMEVSGRTEMYKSAMRHLLFNKVKNNEENYKNLVNELIER
jgi:hypothetical protein